MAARQSAPKGAGVLDDIDSWMAQRRDDVQRLGNQAVAAGRDAWAQATLAGQNLLARQPSDVAALGARVLNGRSQPAAPAQPDADRAPNAPTPAPDFAPDSGGLARRLGNVVGVGRGVVHSAEGLLGGVQFLSRLANPYDRIINPPGARAPDQVIGAGNQVAGYAVNGVLNPGGVLQDIKSAVHRLHVDVDPNASPPASTPAGEFQRNFNIGQNQGELGLDAGLLAFSGPLAKGLESLTAAPEIPGIAKYLAQGFTKYQSEYLAQPYKGRGHHFAIRQSIIDKFHIP